MPQRKKFDAPAELPKLTPKQTAFCSAILSGKTQREAYRAAYDVKGMSEANIDCEASRLCCNPKIAPWLAAARVEAFQVQVQARALTIEEHLTELARIKALALLHKNFTAALQAEHFRGKVSGLYVEQYANVTPPDPVRALRKIAEKTPELARALAQIHGIEFEPERVH